MSGGLDPLGMLLLVLGVLQAGLLSLQAPLRLPQWAVALLVFGTLVCLVWGLAMLVL